MSEQTIDKATIVNWALTDIGFGPAYSIDTEDSIGGTVDAVWPRVIDETFTLHDWTFCRRTRKLTRLSSFDDNGWKYGFSLPGDRMGPPLKVLDQAGHSPRPLRRFDIEGTFLFADVEHVWARCKVAVKPEAWEPGFRVAFTTALAGHLAIPMQQDADLRAEFLTAAFGSRSEGRTGGLFGRLIAQDRASAPIGSEMGSDWLDETRA